MTNRDHLGWELTVGFDGDESVATSVTFQATEPEYLPLSQAKQIVSQLPSGDGSAFVVSVKGPSYELNISLYEEIDDQDLGESAKRVWAYLEAELETEKENE